MLTFADSQSIAIKSSNTTRLIWTSSSFLERGRRPPEAAPRARPPAAAPPQGPGCSVLSPGGAGVQLWRPGSETLSQMSEEGSVVVGGHPRVAAGWRPAQRHVPERHRADGEAGGPRSLPPPQARLPPPGDAPGGTQAPCPPPRVARSPLPGELRGAGPTGSAGLTFAELARKRLGELTPRSGRSVPPRLCPFLGLPSSDSACRTGGPLPLGARPSR